jgi:hypothetical protein
MDGDLSGNQEAFREALRKLEFKNYIDALVKLDHNMEWAPGAGRVSRVGLTGWPGFWRKAHAETPIPQR